MPAGPGYRFDASVRTSLERDLRDLASSAACRICAAACARSRPGTVRAPISRGVRQPKTVSGAGPRFGRRALRRSDQSLSRRAGGRERAGASSGAKEMTRPDGAGVPLSQRRVRMRILQRERAERHHAAEQGFVVPTPGSRPPCTRKPHGCALRARVEANTCAMRVGGYPDGGCGRRR